MWKIYYKVGDVSDAGPPEVRQSSLEEESPARREKTDKGTTVATSAVRTVFLEEKWRASDPATRSQGKLQRPKEQKCQGKGRGIKKSSGKMKT